MLAHIVPFLFKEPAGFSCQVTAAQVKSTEAKILKEGEFVGLFD